MFPTGIKIGKYMIAEAAGASATGKTIVYNIFNSNHGAKLGEVKWYGPWRQYTFFPNEELRRIIERKKLKPLGGTKDTEMLSMTREKFRLDFNREIDEILEQVDAKVFSADCFLHLHLFTQKLNIAQKNKTDLTLQGVDQI